MNQDRTSISSPNLPALLEEFQMMVQNGWEIDPGTSATEYLTFYHINLVRDEKKIKEHAQRILDDNPKMSRTDILAKARAARKPKQE